MLPEADGEDPYEEPYVDAYAQALAKAVQSIAQSAAISVQDATDMMRNVTTIELTAIGVATAKWMADPANTQYEKVIDKSLKIIEQTAGLYEEIGQKAAAVLQKFKQVR